jgi:short-subunit dehydrogenase
MTTPFFRDQAVIVTGASSGIGRALALRLADQGARVTLAARNVARLEALAQECRQRGGQAFVVPADVANEAQCRALVARTLGEYGCLDMLINNAGIGLVARLDELHDLHLFKQVLDVNLYGALHCTYYALPHLKQTHGRLVNISSLGGRVAIPHNTAYIASKFALEGFSESLRMEVQADGVSVTVISPYWVITEFHEHYMDKDGQAKGPSGRAIYTDKTMTADECARISLEAARRRKRQVVMGPGHLLLWLKLIAPNWLDRLTIALFLRPMARRVREASQQEVKRS